MGCENSSTVHRQKAAPTCFLCNPQLRDPMTIAVSFMKNPARFRRCCQFTVKVWDQAVFLEGPLPSAIGQFGAPANVSHMTSFPLLLPNLEARNNQKTKNQICKNQICTLTLQNIPRLTKLEDNFLYYYYTSLKEAVFQDLPELTEVGGRWMSRCTALESITMSNLPKLSKVGDWFLYNCTSLKEAVLQDLPELAEGEDGWIGSCTTLRSITITKVPRDSETQ